MRPKFNWSWWLCQHWYAIRHAASDQTHLFPYYISKLVRALWLVKLAGRTLLHGPPNFEVFFLLLPNCCVIHHQSFLTYIASKSLKPSFTLNCVLKRGNHLKTISNWVVLLSICFRNLKPSLMNGNRFRTHQQSHNRDIVTTLLTSSSRSVL